MHGGAGASRGPDFSDMEMSSADLKTLFSSSVMHGDGIDGRRSSLALHGSEVEGCGLEATSKLGDLVLPSVGVDDRRFSQTLHCGEAMGRGPDPPPRHGGGCSNRDLVSRNLDLTSEGLKARSLNSEAVGNGAGGRLSPALMNGGDVDGDTNMEVSELQMGSQIASVVVDTTSILGALPDSFGHTVCKSFDTNCAALSHPSADVSKGNANNLGAGQSTFFAPQTRTQGICLNADSSYRMPVMGNSGTTNSANPWFNKTMPWRKQKFVPLSTLESLSHLSSEDAVAILDEDAIDDSIKKLEHAIVGRMFGRRIPFPVLSGELRRRWGGFGNFRLVTLSSDCFICIFDNLEACNAILLDGPWVILGQVLGVDRWTSSFSPSSLEGFRTPIWICMPSLPLYCWSSINISKIAALVGEPLWMDSVTDQLENGLFAHACVRLDLSKPLRYGVWIQGRHGKFFQPLEYEGLLIFCYHCSQVGHKASSCKSAGTYSGKGSESPSMAKGECQVTLKTHGNSVGVSHKMDASAKGTEVRPNTLCMNDLKDVEPHSEDRGAGPWMMVTRNKKYLKAALYKHNWKISFVKPYADFHARPIADIYSSRLGSWSQHQTSPSIKNKTKGSLSPITGTEKPLCMDSINPPVMEKWESQPVEEFHPISLVFSDLSKRERQLDLDSERRHFDTQCVEVLQKTKLKTAEPQMEEGQSDLNRMEEGHAEFTFISSMPKDSKIEKMEEATHMGDGHVSEQQHFELEMEGMQPIFPAFSALPVTAKTRSRGGKTGGAKKEKMVCELGPVAPGSRKRRKTQSLTDGGDASPSSPP